MRAASLISTSGAALTGAVCARTTARSVSTVSFAWQQGHVTSIVGVGLFGMEPFYAKIAFVAQLQAAGVVLARIKTRRLKPTLRSPPRQFISSLDFPVAAA